MADNFSAPKPRSLPTPTNVQDLSSTLAAWKSQLNPLVANAAPPSTPVNFRVTSARGGLQLSWSPVAGADGYEILKSANGSFTDDLIVIPVSGANNSGYFDALGGSSQTAHYRVRTTSGTGNNPQSQRGPESGVVSHTSLDAADTKSAATTVLDNFTSDKTRAGARRGNYGAIKTSNAGTVASGGASAVSSGDTASTEASPAASNGAGLTFDKIATGANIAATMTVAQNASIVPDANLPGVIDATDIQGNPVTTATPADGNVLAYSSTDSQYDLPANIFVGPGGSGDILPATANTTQSLGSASARWAAILDTLKTGTMNGVVFVDGNKYTTIAAALAALPSTGGTVYVPDGAYTSGALTIGAMDGSKPTLLVLGPHAQVTITAPITMGSDAQILMLSRNGSKIIADAAFVGSYLVDMGDGSNLIFRSKITGGTLNCSSVAGITGIRARGWNEQSGLDGVIVQNYKTNGVLIDGAAVNTANWCIRSCELGAGSGASHGIKITEAFTGYIESLTANINFTFISAAGVYITGSSDQTNIRIIDYHCENHTDGVKIDKGALWISGLEVTANVVNALHIASGARIVSAAMLKSNQNSGSNPVVLNDVTTTSISSANPPAPAGYIGRYEWLAGQYEMYTDSTGLKFLSGTETLGVVPSWPSQSANQFWGGPSGSSGVPSFRSLAVADIPNLDTSKITTGQLALARGGTASDLSATGGASQVLKQVSSGAAITVGQLAASDLSNGTTGSGAAVLASSPTLATPVLGVASATSVNFGGTALSHYDEGTWTPTASGVTTTGTVTYSGSYTRVGRLVYFTITVTMAAASTSAATAGANFTLPISAARDAAGVISDNNNSYTGSVQIHVGNAYVTAWTTSTGAANALIYISGSYEAS